MKHDPSVHPSSALLLSAPLPPSLLLCLLCAGGTLVYLEDFESCGEVSIFQPNRGALGSTSTALQEAANRARVRNSGFPGAPVVRGNF